MKVHLGFNQTSHRLIVDLPRGGAKFKLHTILPNGEDENGASTLQYREDKVLMTPAYEQEISDEVAFAKGWKTLPYFHLPYIRWNGIGPHGLVQLWPRNVNDEFKSLNSVTNENPDPEIFSQVAVDRLERMMKELYPNAKPAVRFCRCLEATKNREFVFVGTAHNLLQFAREKAVQKHFNIIGVVADGFFSRPIKSSVGLFRCFAPFIGKKRKWTIGDEKVERVMYTKKTGTTQVCTALKPQFEKECKLLFPHVMKREYKIPRSNLEVETPGIGSCEQKVAELPMSWR